MKSLQAQKRVAKKACHAVQLVSEHCSGFSLGRLHMGGGGGTSAGKQSVNGGGLMRRDIDLVGGPNFDRLYHKLKVLSLLSCNYMMQFISYDSIKTR